jgi:hypothetical protein
MATTKTKEELVRLAWITEMRRRPERQCHGVSRDGHQVCALILLADMTGGGVPRYTKRPMRNAIDYPTIAARAGLSPEQSQLVIQLNDSGEGPAPLTFPEIADQIESWFAKQE